MLLFRHPAVGSCYVHAVYSNGKVYLPLGELLRLLVIHFEKSESGTALEGIFPDDSPWLIDPDLFIVQKDREFYELTPDDFRMEPMDIFLLPEWFGYLFGLYFTVDMTRLHLNLKCKHSLPAEERRKRSEIRRRLNAGVKDHCGFPLLFPRNRKLAGAGFVDYSVGAQLSSFTNNLNYTFTGGMELLAGDIQGSFMGFHHRTGNTIQTSNIHWRWVLPENPILTTIRVGNLNTTGLQHQQIVGYAITNDPVMPRKMNGIHLIDGHTIPESEVELFVNNQLVDYTHADELGYYKFDCPLNYGTIRIRLQIYTPSGQILTEEKQMQVPYTFLPGGVITYHLQGGFIPKDFDVARADRQVVHGDVAWGIASGLTLKAGADYFGPSLVPVCYGSVSARLFEQYILNIDVAPGAIHRFRAGVTYASGKSMHVSYSGYENNQVFQAATGSKKLTANLYLPFKISGLYSGLRFWGEHVQYKKRRTDTNFRLGLNTRAGRINLRVAFEEQLRLQNVQKYSYEKSRITAAGTWNVLQRPDLPRFLKGMFIRLQTQFDVKQKDWNSVCMQISGSINRTSRLQLNADYHPFDRYLFLQSVLTVDLPSIRSVTRLNFSGIQYNLSQKVSGSLALDADKRHLSATNRSRAGQCAASVRMFIDANHDSLYNEGEEIIPTSAIKINGGVNIESGKDSILRITRLHNYWHYQAEIIQSALPDPTLAPLVNNFSFDADPNRYKPIDIPLYRTGVIEGTVFVKRGGNPPERLPGVRVILRKLNQHDEKILRTFNDGGFYDMNLLPGKYVLEVDPAQIGFLHASCVPEMWEIEVKPRTDGDFIEGLTFVLLTNESTEEKDQENYE